VRNQKRLTESDGADERVGASEGAADLVGWLDNVGYCWNRQIDISRVSIYDDDQLINVLFDLVHKQNTY
jgi:hypothetical protein